jgi:hypothetical protein
MHAPGSKLCAIKKNVGGGYGGGGGYNKKKINSRHVVLKKNVIKKI